MTRTRRYVIRVLLPNEQTLFYTVSSYEVDNGFVRVTDEKTGRTFLYPQCNVVIEEK